MSETIIENFEQISSENILININDENEVILENESEYKELDNDEYEGVRFECEGIEHTSDDDNLTDLNEARFNHIVESLAEWGKKGVSGQKIDELLLILRPVYPSLPKSYRTLLKTPRKNDIVNMESGKFWYKGIVINLQSRLTAEYLEKKN